MKSRIHINSFSNRVNINLTLILITLFIMGSCKTTTTTSSKSLLETKDTPSKKISLTEAQLENWNKSDPILDTIPGMSVDRAYRELIKNRKGETIIVAVIDTGVDIEHEDLDDVIWVNPKEIIGNKIDDDNNGYVDDINGWNFLGDVENENLEYVRILKKNKSKFEANELDSKEQQFYKGLQAEYEQDYQTVSGKKEQYKQLLNQLNNAHSIISQQIAKEDYSSQDLLALQSEDDEVNGYVDFLSQMYNYIDHEQRIPDFINNIKEGIHQTDQQLNYHLNWEFDGRAQVGDNIDDIKDFKYGNNNVIGPDSEKKGILHGTHVAGIIAAERQNGKGTNGIAQNVKLMSIRAVPNGDEYDKDIALAIRYAVDNGAKIINASFGKYYSTHPEWVKDAIKYAAKHDVLIVNAAGNENVSLDQKQIYPNDQEYDSKEITNNFITVGALNYEYGEHIIAGFSNYGKNNVDVFAPGVKIFSTTPNNTYGYLQGTSLAAPAVSGVAALIRSYYPKLKASEVKQIILDSGIKISSTAIVGNDNKEGKHFEDLCKSGKIVNLFNALILAEK
ncbi:S8 family peptidase [Aquimarina pacifica]|uniref:S8 family peptidase n=1 Tax=Aquimarina pacifica TaxID=1296415 RepID=UPI00046F17FD|nr:S8 family peptidase [Aquimarina pacifica]